LSFSVVSVSASGRVKPSLLSKPTKGSALSTTVVMLYTISFSSFSYNGKIFFKVCLEMCEPSINFDSSTLKQQKL
jgi:hypothetical protein